jgi:hypothetical protein
MRRQVMQPFRAPRKKNVAQEKITLAQKDTTDSEEPTEMGLVWPPLIIKETHYSDVEEARVEASANGNGNEQAVSSNVASPSCSKFEAFLEKASVAAVTQKKQSKTDAYWENVLQREKIRLANEINARVISVEDIMLGESSDDNNVPIAETIQGTKDNLSLLVNVATATITSPSLRTKTKTKVEIDCPLPNLIAHPNHKLYSIVSKSQAKKDNVALT